MKQCTKCKEWKEEGEFSKNKQCGGGLRPVCKTCTSEYNRLYHKKRKSLCSILKNHAFLLRDDPDRLTTDYIKKISGIRKFACKDTRKEEGNYPTATMGA